MSPRTSAVRLAFGKAAIALVVIWTCVATGVSVARSSRITAAGVIRFLREQDVAKLPANTRELVIREAASRINRLTLDQMREVQASRALFLFYRPLHPLEKERFAAKIVPTGLRRILDATREVPRAERSAFLERAAYLAVLDFSIAEPPIDPAALERIEKDALRVYISELGLADRLELEPQLQQLHDYLHPAE
jgi:hypothetical protein